MLYEHIFRNHILARDKRAFGFKITGSAMENDDTEFNKPDEDHLEEL